MHLRGVPCYDRAAIDITRQREYWDGHPVELGDAWTLRKEDKVARCILVSHPLGWELGLMTSDLLRSQVCRSSDEVLTTLELWKAAHRLTRPSHPNDQTHSHCCRVLTVVREHVSDLEGRVRRLRPYWSPPLAVTYILLGILLQAWFCFGRDRPATRGALVTQVGAGVLYAAASLAFSGGCYLS
jgi:hypothetical protein